jgi:hypothetical protein
MTLLRAVLCLLAAWAVSAADAAAGEIRRGLQAPSPALGRSIPYAIYLPDGYEGVPRVTRSCSSCTGSGAPRTTG